MLERTDSITNEVLETVTFVLAYPTLYGSARVDNYIIVAMKESKHAPFQGRQDCPWRLLLQTKHKKHMGARERATIAPFSPCTI